MRKGVTNKKESFVYQFLQLENVNNQWMERKRRQRFL